jgi:hypothetical protein
VALTTFAVYAIYATKLLKAQDREARWAYIAPKRMQQDVLDAQIAMDTATLALMGERHPPRSMRGATPELKSALAHAQHRVRVAEQRAEAAEAVKEGTATYLQRRTLTRLRSDRRPASPKGPAIEPIKARREALVAERAEVEAEIQALATAEDIEKARTADEVEGKRRTRRELQDAARKADQAARDRVRVGRRATQREPEHVIGLQISMNGTRDVSSGRGPATPEQIAKGENAA